MRLGLTAEMAQCLHCEENRIGFYCYVNSRVDQFYQVKNSQWDMCVSVHFRASENSIRQVNKEMIVKSNRSLALKSFKVTRSREGGWVDSMGGIFGIRMSTRKAIVKVSTRRGGKDKKERDIRSCFVACLQRAGASTCCLDQRRCEESVVEAITDHGGLNKHLFDMWYVNCPKCQCKYIEETVITISDCPRHRLSMKPLLDKSDLYGPDLNINSMDSTKLTLFFKKTSRFPW